MAGKCGPSFGRSQITVTSDERGSQIREIRAYLFSAPQRANLSGRKKGATELPHQFRGRIKKIEEGKITFAPMEDHNYTGITEADLMKEMATVVAKARPK